MGSVDVGGVSTTTASWPLDLVQLAERPGSDTGMLVSSSVKDPVRPEIVMLVPCVIASVVLTATVILLSAPAICELSDTGESRICTIVMVY